MRGNAAIGSWVILSFCRAARAGTFPVDPRAAQPGPTRRRSDACGGVLGGGIDVGAVEARFTGVHLLYRFANDNHKFRSFLLARRAEMIRVCRRDRCRQRKEWPPPPIQSLG